MRPKSNPLYHCELLLTGLRQLLGGRRSLPNLDSEPIASSSSEITVIYQFPIPDSNLHSPFEQTSVPLSLKLYSFEEYSLLEIP
jgi:hypothetical protein